VAGAKITVVSDSTSVRESVDVALGARYLLTHFTAAEARSRPGGIDEASWVICEAPTSGTVFAPPLVALPKVLWIVAAGAQAPNGAGENVIAFPFLPETLRAKLAHALAAAPLRGARAALSSELGYPLVPQNAVAVASKAAQTSLPVLITGASGTGTRRLARQIHVASGGGRFLTVPAARLSADIVAAARTARSDRGTLCIDRLDTLTPAGAELLAELLDDEGCGSPPGTATRLICTAEIDADTLPKSTGLERDLFYRLAVLPIHLPALRDRGDEMAAIAATVLARLAVRHAPESAPRLGDDALARLRRYPWPGNLAELEAVLTRSLVFLDGDVLHAGDLLFDLEGAGARESPQAASSPAAGASVAVDRPVGFDLLLNDLAHELKNPMVTIKTVAQHLERLLDEESGQREMVRMTGEAVDRMDRALENLLQFTRFEAPLPRDTSIADVLGECLEAIDAEVALHRVLLDDRVAPAATVRADRSQLVYALENLLRAVLRTAGDGTTLVMRTPLTRTGLVLEFPTSTASVTAKLARWSDGAPAATAVESSIQFVFARALIERNGGTVGVRVGDGRTVVSVDLPAGGDEAEEDDDEATYLDR